jgi:ribonucleoside-diphosphate reductase alpha chain
MPEFDLDSFKKTWQEQPVQNKYGDNEILQMLNRKSRNYVKYIFWISVAEFLLFSVIGIFYFFQNEEDNGFLNILEKLGAQKTPQIESSFDSIYWILKISSLIVTAYFVFKFYQNYRKIRIEEKRKVWARVLESRQQKGLPYIFFTDNVNRNKPQVYKDLGLTVNASNLCSEIMLPSTMEESFICCLSSMNLELYDEWKDTDAVKLAIYFLDAVLSEFIDKTEGNYYLQGARNFAMRHRALGLGVLGYHSYLQKNMIPFESFEATQFNARAFRRIKEQAEQASRELANIYGEPELLKGYGLRNTTTMAIAPTTSSSAILGQTSPGIEPFASNYFKAGLAKGNFMRKNKYLAKLLAEKGLDNEETWRTIMLNHGSVQHLKELTDEEKAVFKTFKEISPMEIISQAAQRQQYIDQAQSLNLQIPSTMPVKDVNYLYIEAWKKGVKTLYYQRSSSVSK